MVPVWSYLLAIPLIIWLYVRDNDKKLRSLPSRASERSPKRISPADSIAAAEKLKENPIDVTPFLGKKTGRRYIVVGGTGFLGGWIVLHLIQRGEDPRRIRSLDIKTATRRDLQSGPAAQVEFFKVDISKADQVEHAFSAPWPTIPGETEAEITVIHTAASIRFYERHPSLLQRSLSVNLDGMNNLIEASVKAGVSIFISTSSGSQGIRSTRFLLWPWEKEPEHFVQFIGDGPEGDALYPIEHGDFFSNYAASKAQGEAALLAANGRPSGSGVLKVGCIRPGNGVFGPGGDMLCGACLVRKTTPTFISTVLQDFLYVENCSIAHLLFEAALLPENASKRDLSGLAFNIHDPNPPITYGDTYTLMGTLESGLSFPELSPTLTLLLAHVVEWITLTKYFLSVSSIPFYHFLSSFVPTISGDVSNLQPSLWNLVQAHTIFDDSRAGLPLDQGGLGYKGVFTTTEGLCKTVDEYVKGGRASDRGEAVNISVKFGQRKQT